jgi:hypothetical protein
MVNRDFDEFAFLRSSDYEKKKVILVCHASACLYVRMRNAQAYRLAPRQRINGLTGSIHIRYSEVYLASFGLGSVELNMDLNGLQNTKREISRKRLKGI